MSNKCVKQQPLEASQPDGLSRALDELIVQVDLKFSHPHNRVLDTSRGNHMSVTTSYGKLPAHQNAMTEGLKSDVCSRIMGDEFAAPK